MRPTHIIIIEGDPLLGGWWTTLLISNKTGDTQSQFDPMRRSPGTEVGPFTRK